ncbi:MAG: phage integrase SAM-like domain-containing protein [Planctomycetota bacterium]
MASVVSQPNGRFCVQFKRPDGKRDTMRLGKVDRRTAQRFAERIDELITGVALRQPLHPNTADWLASLPAKTHDKLSKAGLVSKRESTPVVTVGELTAHYLQHKVGKPSTLKKYENAAENLRKFFGDARNLNDLTEGDADEFKAFLLTKANRQTGGPLAPPTAQKRLQRAKAILKFAVKKRWLTVNPFEDAVLDHAAPLVDRYHFVDAETTYKLLDSCDELEFRTLLAIVRFGGLRHRSETTLLEWSWVDWNADTIRFRSPKTEHLPRRAWRTIPIFAELRPYLEAAWEAAPDGARLILPSLQVSNYATTKRLRRLCRRVGIELWDKPWVNLRSTRETEIEELFGLKAACDWIGNTEAVARKSYLQITAIHHARAIADGAGAKRPLRATNNATHDRVSLSD